jgi:hypothetical protein
MTRPKMLSGIALSLILFGTLQGCATASAKLCRRDPLVHPEIRFDDTGNNFVIDDHIYFSKEASSGGRGFGGGGCGCN